MFGYEGKVTVIRRYKDRILGRSVFHNNGTPELFKILCDRLVRGIKSETDLVYPERLDLVTVDEQESCLRQQLIPVFEAVEASQEGDYKAVKRFYLSYYDLLDSNPEASMKWQLKSRQGDVLASVELLSKEGAAITEYKISPGESHEIIWEMFFKNIDSQTTKSGE